MRPRLAALVAVLALAGCGDTVAIHAGGEVSGDTLTVYSLLPQEGPYAAAARDIVDGQKMAIEDEGRKVGAYKVNFASLDSGTRPRAVADAARTAIHDPATIAIIADVDFRSARVDVPLINTGGILHVSPGVTYGGFLARVPGIDPEAPGRWVPSGRRTYAPVLPPHGAQAAALARAARGRVAVEADADDPSRALAMELRAQLDRVVPTARADTVIYASDDVRAAPEVVEGILRENRRARVLLPEALFLGGVADRLPRRVAARVGFVTTTEKENAIVEYPHSVGPYAQAGYDAMQSILDAIRAAGKRANQRQAVIDTYFKADPIGRAVTRPSWLVTFRGGKPRYSVVAG